MYWIHFLNQGWWLQRLANCAWLSCSTARHVQNNGDRQYSRLHDNSILIRGWHSDNYTVYVQISKARKFRGCHKSSIFTMLFLRITKHLALWFMQIKVRQWNFKDENFADGQFTAKTSKITSFKNLLYMVSCTPIFVLPQSFDLLNICFDPWLGE